MNTKSFLVVAALMLSVCVASAQGPKGQAQKKQQINFVDANGDGICDNKGTAACKFFICIGLNKDGVCVKCKNPDCTGFVDADGDGKCDNCPNAGTCTPVGTQPKDGTGQQKGKK